MKCEISKVKSQERGGFIMSLFLLNASENLCKKRSRKKKTAIVKKQNFGGLLNLVEARLEYAHACGQVVKKA